MPTARQIMPAKKVDIHKELGQKQTVDSEEAVLSLVRDHYPNAFQEGSTGPQRTWWIRQDKEIILIGHSWLNRAGKYSVRVNRKTDEF